MVELTLVRLWAGVVEPVDGVKVNDVPRALVELLRGVSTTRDPKGAAKLFNPPNESPSIELCVLRWVPSRVVPNGADVRTSSEVEKR